MHLGAGAGRVRFKGLPGSIQSVPNNNEGVTEPLHSPAREMFKTRPLRSDTRHKICSLMMFGNHLISFMARLTPFWKSENRGLKNIILAMTVMRDDSVLCLPCLVLFAIVHFSNFVQGVALNNSKSARMISMKCAANLWLCMTQAIFYTASPFINSVIFRNSGWEFMCIFKLCSVFMPHWTIRHASHSESPLVSTNQSGARGRQLEAANSKPGLAMTGAGPGRSRLRLEMLHPYEASSPCELREFSEGLWQLK